MRKAPATPLSAAPPTPSHELEVGIAMPPEVREAVIDLVAQILVLDYQLFQGVTEPTGKTTPVYNRKLRLVKSEEEAG